MISSAHSSTQYLQLRAETHDFRRSNRHHPCLPRNKCFLASLLMMPFHILTAQTSLFASRMTQRNRHARHRMHHYQWQKHMSATLPARRMQYAVLEVIPMHAWLTLFAREVHVCTSLTTLTWFWCFGFWFGCKHHLCAGGKIPCNEIGNNPSDFLFITKSLARIWWTEFAKCTHSMMRVTSTAYTLGSDSGPH